jgi:hypothetical protein
MPYQADNRKHVRAAEKAQLASLMVRGEVITGIMSVINGRQWMHELLTACHVFTDPFSADPYVHAANSGQRAIGLQLFADVIGFCPKHFTTMIEESNVRNSTNDERTRSPQRDGGTAESELDRGGRNGADFEYDPNNRDEADGDEARY